MDLYFCRHTQWEILISFLQENFTSAKRGALEFKMNIIISFSQSTTHVYSSWFAGDQKSLLDSYSSLSCAQHIQEGLCTELLSEICYTTLLALFTMMQSRLFIWQTTAQHGDTQSRVKLASLNMAIILVIGTQVHSHCLLPGKYSLQELHAFAVSLLLALNVSSLTLTW